MKIRPYIEKLELSKEYAKFSKQYKDAFLVAGFFVLDFETGQNINQIDYYIPSKKKVAAFTMADRVDIKILEMMNQRIPEKLNLKTNIDLEAIKGILEDEMKNRSMSEEIRKIIAIIQNLEGKKIWTLNCILSGMEILKAHVDDDSKTVLSMERVSVMDYVKKMPMQQQIIGQGQSQDSKMSEEEIDDQLLQLDKLKKELEKQKAKLSNNKKINKK